MNATVAHRFTFCTTNPLYPQRGDTEYGPDYEVELVFAGPVRAGLVVSDDDVQHFWDPAHEVLDYHVLERVDGLPEPTIVNIASWLLVQLTSTWVLPDVSALLTCVRVRESGMSTWCAICREDLSPADFERLRYHLKD